MSNDEYLPLRILSQNAGGGPCHPLTKRLIPRAKGGRRLRAERVRTQRQVTHVTNVSLAQIRIERGRPEAMPSQTYGPVTWIVTVASSESSTPSLAL